MISITATTLAAKYGLASDLPIYSAAVKRWPHLVSIPDARTFCQQLGNLQGVIDGLTIMDTLRIGNVANGGRWEDDLLPEGH